MTMTDAASDPYRYLEDGSDPATIAWTAEQNARTRAVLDMLPMRENFARRFEQILDVGTMDVPHVCGARAFYTARRGSSEQASLYVREGGDEKTLLDPVELDSAGLTTIDWWYPSGRGRYVAFGLSKRGDERSTLYVIDVASGEHVHEAIPDTRYASVAWFADESGFFYTRYPAGADYGVSAYRHVLGTPPALDELVFGEGLKAEETIALAISSDGRYLVACTYLGWARGNAYLADTTLSPLRFTTMVEGVDAYYAVSVTNDKLYVRTDEGAPRFRLFEVDPSAPQRAHWREIVAETDAVLDAVTPTKHALVLHYFENVRSVLRARHVDGAIETVDVLSDASIINWSSHEDDDTLYVLSASYFEPPTVRAVRFDGARGYESEIWGRVVSAVDASRYRVKQHWYVSKDGTRVPMDVLAHKDTPLDGSAPAVLYGYGGFNVSLTPSFAPSVTPWLDAGGVYAIANLRGGGEFGEEWHRSGMLERKQNVFDDFIAAVEYLGSEKIADARRIVVYGGSNGGLLVAALATQRPELVRAVVCVVPLTDMLRYHLFLIARLWIPEYGDPERAADAAVLRAYSPYHNVSEGVAYPAMLVESAESDSRVDPMHARKFAARVQAATTGDAPILAYIEADAGHGVGKPRYKVVSELADKWSFIAWQVGI